jgi:hypothetical protein
VVTRLRSRDELELHVGTRSVAARLAALTWYEHADAPNGSRDSQYIRSLDRHDGPALSSGDLQTA